MVGPEKRKAFLMKVQFPNQHRTDPTKDAGQKVDYAPAKRVAFRARWYVLLVVIFSPVAFFLWQISKDDILVRSSGIVTTNPVILSASQAGYVSDISVSPGDQVTRGQSIIKLSSPELEVKLGVLENSQSALLAAQVETRKNVLGILEAQAESLERAKAAQMEIRRSYEILERKDLMTNARQIQLDSDRLDLNVQIVENQLAVEDAKARLHSGGISAAIRDIDLEIALVNVQRDLMKIRAVDAGTVNKLFVVVGEYVEEGDILAELSNYEKPVVNVYLNPERMKFAVEGNVATIIFPDGSKYSGVVSEPVQITETIPAALAGPFEGSKSAVKVVLSFDDPPATWIEGLPVEVRFQRGGG
jgi:multidrug resistance efflux pump